MIKKVLVVSVWFNLCVHNGYGKRPQNRLMMYRTTTLSFFFSSRSMAVLIININEQIAITKTSHKRSLFSLR